MIGRRSGIAAGLAAALLATAIPALAQSTASQSAEQIIAALRPASVPPAARGIASMPVKPPSVDLSVHFDPGSARITPRVARTLDELGRALTSTALSGYRFRIEGHTDTVGSPDYNLLLSGQRASSAARYLEARFGIAPARLEVAGLGDRALLVATPPQTPEERNRRVHVVNLGN